MAEQKVELPELDDAQLLEKLAEILEQWPLYRMFEYRGSTYDFVHRRSLSSAEREVQQATALACRNLHWPAVEDEIRGRPPDERKEFASTSSPLAPVLHDWFEVSLTKLSRKLDTTAAIRYALTLWPAFTGIASDGHLEMDNNAAERALCAVTLGRKKSFVRRFRCRRRASCCHGQP